MDDSHAKTRWVAALAAGVLFTAGCTEKQEAPAASAPSVQALAAGGAEVTPAVLAEAESVFANRCTPCHGPRGAGDGPASAGLTPPPRNLQDKAWQGQVSDEHLERIIAYGGGAVGRSPAMPPNPDLADKPVLKGLRQHIRTLAEAK
ncbi:c-type cytochrome [Pyxidicoccus xibeiensis]|uniref:c-type cytochrome n=1 Tax=Pyxidicoccus xibeiensis TaxID=2906759 RepID=UPI0020A790F5|nr:cytochrome c [Pyxidicoccus xibeiensis]MCP3142058.1 c-type cytochrome [Pyxidicoccus xibeiensis]